MLFCFCFGEQLGSMADWAQVLAIVIGGIWALFTWRTSVKTQRSNFVDALLCKVRDTELSEFFYRNIDREDETDFRCYKGGLMFENGYEEIFDRFLFMISYVCYLRRNRLISKRDFKLFEYMIDRTMRSAQVTSYMRDFYADETLSNMSRPYDDLLYISAKMGNQNACEIYSRYCRRFTKEHPLKDIFRQCKCSFCKFASVHSSFMVDM